MNLYIYMIIEIPKKAMAKMAISDETNDSKTNSPNAISDRHAISRNERFITHSPDRSANHAFPRLYVACDGYYAFGLSLKTKKENYLASSQPTPYKPP